MTADDDLIPPVTPETRALEGASGTPVVLGDGNTWLLADGGLLNALDEIRDRMDDESRIGGTVKMADVGVAAMLLLQANYDLGGDEVAALVLRADREALSDAVMVALFGPLRPRRTYTAWAASALLANGVDPASVPGHLRPHVLDQLVATGRAIPLDRYIESAQAAGRFAALRARIRPVPTANTEPGTPA